MAVLSVLTLVLFINLSDVSAANSTFNTTSISNSASTVKIYVETNHKIPTDVTVANKKVTSSQYLYLLTKDVQNVNSGVKTPVTLKYVSKPISPSETAISGTLTKTEYLSISKKITTFIDTYGRVPNYISTSLGTMRYENLIYSYSKVMNFYKTNKRLPNYVSVKPWSSIQAGGTTTGTITVGSNVQSVLDAIGCKEAQYEDIQGQSSPTVMEKVGYGDCWADSGWLYNKLSAAGISVRIMGTSSGGIYYLHRWVQINVGNGWQTWNYAKYNSQHYGALGSGIFVVKTFLA